ncbi:hypothetical protein BYT27DRAFT_7180308 [Phlegmacium glaucopus]|nr:hypothetical protein BYT27DRAFT_7180308 [Phlegmacium glaucopus]
MKLASQSLKLLIIAAFTIPSALAEFHIIEGVAPGGGSGLEACPSNYYDCDCLKDGDRAARVLVNGEGVASLPDNFFSVDAGLCGLGQLDFFKQSDEVWNFYIHEGDGTLQGTCYPNNATNTCSGFYFFDQLVCYSYICNR